MSVPLVQEASRTTQLISLRATELDNKATGENIAWKQPTTQETPGLMPVYASLIINKAGGLVHNRQYNEGLRSLSSNDLLVMAGTFHGIHAIASQISPAGHSSGIEVLDADRFRLFCLQTKTGTKFVIFTTVGESNGQSILGHIYLLYSDYVMKNPFYQLEMPIRCAAFDKQMDAYLKLPTAATAATPT